MSDDLTIVHMHATHKAKKLMTAALARAMGEEFSALDFYDLLDIVRREHSELTRLRVAEAHMQQELLMARRDDIE